MRSARVGEDGDMGCLGCSRGSKVLRACVCWLLGALVSLGLATAPSAVASLSGSKRIEPTSFAAGIWTTYGGSNARISLQARSPSLRQLRLRWRSANLGGAIYGEAIIDAGTVAVATEADTVVALAASTGALRWRTRLGAPVPASMLPCGDITPAVGVTSTMVLDSARGELFASAELLAHGSVEHELFALSLRTGAIAWHRNLDLPGENPAAQLQRSALALADHRILVGFGGNYGDCGHYVGALVGVPESGRGPLSVYRVPTARMGAIWAPSGVSVNRAGDIFFATGNGAATSPSGFDESNSVVELARDFRRIGLFAPRSWLSDNRNDADLGSSAPMLIGNRVFILGKQSTAFLLDAKHLGGIGGELSSLAACFSLGGDAYLAPEIYVACPEASLLALRLSGRALRLSWRAPPSISGSPTVAGGVVFFVANGRLYGLNPRTGAVLLTRPTLTTEHFSAPSAGGGLLIVAGDRSVEAFEGPSGYLQSGAH